ncbi:MAG TPA: hypothetical protein VN622_12245 [Clostridia bacterium]|nr:hypothetical protein [Clostridia bacterium]
MRFEWKASALWIFAVLTLALAGILGWAQAALASGLIMASILLHEVAHIAVAMHHGVKVKALGLNGRGAYTRREHSNRWIVEAQSALAGPSVNLALYIVFVSFSGTMNQMLALSNLVLGVSNLLPFRPLDGWRFWQAVKNRA